MFQIVTTVFIFGIASVSHGSELIATINHDLQFQDADLPLRFSMDVFRFGGMQTGFEVLASPTDIGETFNVFTPLLASILVESDVRFVAFVEGSIPELGFWGANLSFLNATVSNPLGAELQGYEVTGLEARIDSLNFNPASGGFGDAEWTVLVYGQPVPEPSTWIFFLGLFAIRWRIRQRT